MSANTYYAGQVVRAVANFSTSVLLTAPISAGTTVSSLAVDALPAPIAIDDEVALTNGVNVVTFTASAAAIIGATSITVTAQVVPYDFDIGAQVSFPADPTTVALTYQSGRNAATTTVTYANNQVLRSTKGVYYYDLDTTSLPGVWTYYWQTTGIAQTVSDPPVSFTVRPTPF